MQNGQTATDGLYQGPTALSLDIVNVVRRIKLLGFNAVRLPYSMSELINATAKDFHWTYCQNIAQSDILQSVTNPSVSVSAGAPCHDVHRVLRPVAVSPTPNPHSFEVPGTWCNES